MTSSSSVNDPVSLEDGAKALGLSLNAKQFAQLRQYLALMTKWNRTYNLTAVDKAASMISRHLLDSLAIQPFIDSELLIDVGTGGGLPGIPLAIANPDKRVVLIDSNGKKTRFLFQVKLNLNLANVSVENCRVEHYQSQEHLAIVLSRAFANLPDMVNATRHLVGGEKGPGKWFAMKGQYPESELAGLPADVQLLQSERLTIPGEQSERHLLILGNAQA